MTEVQNKHTVIEGETLSHLALRYYGNAAAWPVIYKANKATIERAQRPFRTGRFKPTGPDWIFPGTVIMIPARPNPGETA